MDHLSPVTVFANDRVAEAAPHRQILPLDLLQCPITGDDLTLADNRLCPSGDKSSSGYDITPEGIPLFAAVHRSNDAAVQQEHYDRIANDYLANLQYPHTIEYTKVLDQVFLGTLATRKIGTIAELCCGHGEAFQLIGDQIERGVGVDISPSMLRQAVTSHGGARVAFVQGDATRLPLKANSFDSVFMFGGIHHVNDRQKLFDEVSRILKPGGHFYFREPVSDFFLWRWLRAIIYRVSPTLDANTERPLLKCETWPFLDKAGLDLTHWSTHGFFGFCLLMNSDVLIFNRAFRFLPGIRGITRAAARMDEWITGLPGMKNSGLQVIGVAEKRGG
jgi:ubiquinone/menaquinone biosynthesis C-methylase UbiE